MAASNSTMVRLRPHAHQTLKEIARATGQSLQDALDRAIDDLRRKVYLDGINADYASLRADPKQWEAHQKELDVWEATSGDGLEEL
jgi:hypothetical protein